MHPTLFSNQWPTSDRRLDLAKYVVFNHVPTINTLSLLDQCALGLRLTTSNGMISFKNTNVVVEMQLCGTTAETVTPHKLVAWTVCLLWCLYHEEPASMATFVLDRQHKAPCLFWDTVGYEILFLFMPPTTLSPAFSVGRPDLQLFVMAAYSRWAVSAQNGQLVAQVAALLADTPFDYDSVSCEWLQVKKCFVEDGVVVAGNKQHMVDSSLYTIPASRCNIHVDGQPLMAISMRDKLLLAMRHLWDVRFEWTAKGCPESAPSVFRTLERDHSYLFKRTSSPTESVMARLPAEFTA